MPHDLFPLPLTPFEFYYWCDDRPEYPTTYPVELVFRGVLQRESLQKALQLAVERHPLLCAHVDPTAGKLPAWVSAKGQLPLLDWADLSKPIDYQPHRFIDLAQSVGLRIWVRASNQQSRLVLQFHHACCDAIGAFQFIEDLLVIYDAVVSSSDSESRLRPLDPQRLCVRGDYGLKESGYQPTLGDAWRTARFWARRLLFRPAQLAAPPHVDAEPVSPEAELGYLTVTFSKEELHQIRAAAALCDASINDLLLRDLLLTLQTWNTAQSASAKRWVVNVPVNLRSHGDQQMPVTNLLGYWFLERKPGDLVAHEELLCGIRDEMKVVRKYRLPLFFIGGLGYASRFPGIMRRLLRSRHTFATVVLSNVGRMLPRTPLPRQNRKLICGGAVLERITGIPPIRPGTRVAVAFGYYAGETYVVLQWDPHTFDYAGAEQLLEAYVERLRKSAAMSAVNSRHNPAE